MKRRKAIQTIAMGVSGLGLISQCTLTPPISSHFGRKRPKSSGFADRSYSTFKKYNISYSRDPDGIYVKSN
jgi:hypothetical protein